MTPLLALLLATALQGTPTVDWVDVYNGPPGDQGDGASVVLTDDAGRIFAGGFSLGTLANGNHTADVFVRAYDEAGSVLWSYRYDGGAQDDVEDLALAANGDLLVAGVRDKYTTAYGEDWVIIRLDPATGQARWVTVWDGPSSYNDRPVGVAENSAGQVIVAGASGDNYGANDTRISVCAFDGASGSLIWDTHEIGPWIGSDHASGLALDAQDRIWVSATSNTQNDGVDMALYVFDSGGTKLWQRLHGQSGFMADRGLDVVVDRNGNGVIAGTVWDSVDGDTLHLRSYDPAGNLRWSSTRATPGLDRDWPNDLEIAADGSILVAGETDGSAGREGLFLRADQDSGALLQETVVNSTNGDPSTFLAVAASPDNAAYLTGFSGQFAAAAFTARIAPGGALDWLLEQSTVGGFGEPAGIDVAVGAMSGVYVVGDTWDTNSWYDWFAERIDDGRQGGLYLTVSPLVRGQTADFQLVGAPPSSQVGFLYSMAGTGSGPCPPILNGACLDILAPVTLLATMNSDAAGNAAFVAGVPPNAPLIPIHFQAAAPAAPEPTSNVVAQTVQ